MGIKEIKNIVVNESLKESELLELYKSYLILRQKELSIVPDYNVDYNYYVNSYFTNCYAYSLRLDIPEYFNEKYSLLTGYYFSFVPGVFSSKKYPNNMKSLIDNTLSDLESLKIKLNYELVLLQELKNYNGSKDFHFIRKNICGNYSSKIGMSSYIPKTSYIDILDGYELVKILK